MHNPAWRPAQLHTERLASIQHHFIDERPAAQITGNTGFTHTLPIHLAVAAGHPADALQPQYLMDALTRQLNIQTIAVTKHAAWRVQAISPGLDAYDAEQRFILVFATANLEGVRMAYTGIKQLSATTSCQFGVLFSGADDAELTNRCHERLASGARQFLGIDLHGLGHLSAPGPDFKADIERLAEEVRRLCEVHSTPEQQEVAHT
jgi:hypothetical protein